MSKSNVRQGSPMGVDISGAAGIEIPERSEQRIRVFLIAAFVITVDQVTKWFVLQNMRRDQSIDLLGDWLKFTFTENPGMAFGIEYGHPALITVFSVLATGLILFYTLRIGHIHGPYQISLAFVLGGAVGNIIDRIFYGALLYGTPYFQGKVVDFIHVNVWRGTVSDIVPFFGGKFVALFPIWNVADMAIVLGVVGILFFQKGFHERADEFADSVVEDNVDTDMNPNQRASVLESDGPGEPAVAVDDASTTSPLPRA